MMTLRIHNHQRVDALRLPMLIGTTSAAFLIAAIATLFHPAHLPSSPVVSIVIAGVASVIAMVARRSGQAKRHLALRLCGTAAVSVIALVIFPVGSQQGQLIAISAFGLLFASMAPAQRRLQHFCAVTLGFIAAGYVWTTFTTSIRVPVAPWLQTTSIGLGFGLVSWLGFVVAELKWLRGSDHTSHIDAEIDDLLDRAWRARDSAHLQDPLACTASLDESFQCLEEMAHHWRTCESLHPNPRGELSKIRQRISTLQSHLQVTNDVQVRAEYSAAIATMVEQEQQLRQRQKDREYVRSRMHRCVAAMEHLIASGGGAATPVPQFQTDL